MYHWTTDCCVCQTFGAYPQQFTDSFLTFHLAEGSISWINERTMNASVSVPCNGRCQQPQFHPNLRQFVIARRISTDSNLVLPGEKLKLFSVLFHQLKLLFSCVHVSLQRRVGPVLTKGERNMFWRTWPKRLPTCLSKTDWNQFTDSIRADSLSPDKVAIVWRRWLTVLGRTGSSHWLPPPGSSDSSLLFSWALSSVRCLKMVKTRTVALFRETLGWLVWMSWSEEFGV